MPGAFAHQRLFTVDIVTRRPVQAETRGGHMRLTWALRTQQQDAWGGSSGRPTPPGYEGADERLSA